MIEILFTYKKGSIVSYLIKKITKEPVSHCAIRVGEFVFQSNFRGVNIEPYTIFNKQNNIVYRVEGVNNLFGLRRTLEDNWKKWYDVPALLFLGLRYLFPKIMPKQNLWESSDMFLCTEFVTVFIYKKADSLITPYKLYLKMKNKGN